MPARSSTPLATSRDSRGTGKPGTLTLNIRIIPTKGDHVGVIDSVTVKAPQPDRPESLWFVDHDGNLTRNDPNQIPALRPLDGGSRTVDLETGEIRHAAQ